MSAVRKIEILSATLSWLVALLQEPIAAFDFDPTTVSDLLVGVVPRLSGSIASITLSNALPEPDTQKLKLLDVSPASKNFPRGLDNELQVFSQERPLALGVQARLADGNNPAQGSSDVSGTISLDNIALAAEIFLAYSTYDCESVRLSDVLAFSLDCFVAKLQQGGGLKALAVAVVGLRAELQCSPCSQPVLNDFLNEKLVQQDFLDNLVLTVNKQLVPFYAPKFTLPFDDTNWAATIKNATAKCNGIKITADTPSATPGSSDVAIAPAAGASIAVAAVAAIAGAATIVVAVVAVVLHRRRASAGDKRPAATTDVACSNRPTAPLSWPSSSTGAAPPRATSARLPPRTSLPCARCSASAVLASAASRASSSATTFLAGYGSLARLDLRAVMA